MGHRMLTVRPVGVPYDLLSWGEVSCSSFPHPPGSAILCIHWFKDCVQNVLLKASVCHIAPEQRAQ